MKLGIGVLYRKLSPKTKFREKRDLAILTEKTQQDATVYQNCIIPYFKLCST
jgi:hypothetical protein